jgi:hypothetical protein
VDWAKICAHVQPHTFVISSPWSSTNLESLGKLGFTLIVIEMATATTSAHAAALTAVAGGATLPTISAATLALGAPALEKSVKVGRSASMLAVLMLLMYIKKLLVEVPSSVVVACYAALLKKGEHEPLPPDSTEAEAHLHVFEHVAGVTLEGAELAAACKAYGVATKKKGAMLPALRAAIRLKGWEAYRKLPFITPSAGAANTGTGGGAGAGTAGDAPVGAKAAPVNDLTLEPSPEDALREIMLLGTTASSTSTIAQKPTGTQHKPPNASINAPGVHASGARLIEAATEWTNEVDLAAIYQDKAVAYTVTVPAIVNATVGQGRPMRLVNVLNFHAVLVAVATFVLAYISAAGTMYPATACAFSAPTYDAGVLTVVRTGSIDTSVFFAVEEALSSASIAAQVRALLPYAASYPNCFSTGTALAKHMVKTWAAAVRSAPAAAIKSTILHMLFEALCLGVMILPSARTSSTTSSRSRSCSSSRSALWVRARGQALGYRAAAALRAPRPLSTRSPSACLSRCPSASACRTASRTLPRRAG